MEPPVDAHHASIRKTVSRLKGLVPGSRSDPFFEARLRTHMDLGMAAPSDFKRLLEEDDKRRKTERRAVPTSRTRMPPRRGRKPFKAKGIAVNNND